MTRLVGWWLLLAVVLTTILLFATQPRPTGRHPWSLGLDLYRQADGLHVAAMELESGGHDGAALDERQVGQERVEVNFAHLWPWARAGLWFKSRSLTLNAPSITEAESTVLPSLVRQYIDELPEDRRQDPESDASRILSVGTVMPGWGESAGLVNIVERQFAPSMDIILWVPWGLVPVYAAWLLHNVITGIRADVQSSEATEG